MRSRWQNAEVEAFVNIEEVSYLSGKQAPLVVAEVVDDNEEYLFAGVKQGENLFLEDVGAHHWPFGVALSHPVEIVLGNVFGETVVGIFFLHDKHVCHAAIGVAQFELPMHQPFVDVAPVAESAAIVDEH